MKKNIIIESILSLTEKLISIHSDSGNGKELDKILELLFDTLPGFTIERFTDNDITSALFYVGSKRPSCFTILLNGHVDVIPGKEFQYSPKREKDKLYGVGAMDMKASLACLIFVFKAIAKNVSYPLALQIVSDEETGGFHGTKYQIDNGVKADFVIAGEATNLNIVTKAKGILCVKIISQGISSHSAYPWRGKNAIWEMSKFLTLLEKAYPIPNHEVWKTTVNMSSIATTNQAFNKIPDECEIWLDIRYIPEVTNEILPSIKSLLPPGFRLEVVEQEPAFAVNENNHYITVLQKITAHMMKKRVSLYGAQGSSDARHFTQRGMDGIEFGPSGGGIGSDSEWISIQSLQQYYFIMKEFLLSIDVKKQPKMNGAMQPIKVNIPSLLTHKMI